MGEFQRVKEAQNQTKDIKELTKALTELRLRFQNTGILDSVKECMANFRALKASQAIPGEVLRLLSPNPIANHRQDVSDRLNVIEQHLKLGAYATRPRRLMNRLDSATERMDHECRQRR